MDEQTTIAYHTARALQGRFKNKDGQIIKIDEVLAQALTQRVLDTLDEQAVVDLFEAGKEAEDVLRFARIFVTSRQRIKNPEGEELYDDALAKLMYALRRARFRYGKNIGDKHGQNRASWTPQGTQGETGR